jgi:hypothetical protein
MSDKNHAMKLIKARIQCAGSAVKSKELEHDFMLPGAVVRSCIRDLRRDGVLITGDDDGYHICKSYEEYQELRASLRSRCLSMFETIKLMDKEAKIQFQKAEAPILELTALESEV